MISLLPLLVAGAALGAIYSTGQALDNSRYWNDYARRTGYRPRYSWRAGKYDFVKNYGKAFTYSATSYGAFFKLKK